MDKLIELIKSLDEEMSQIDAKQAAIEDKALAENGGLMSDEQRAEHDELGKKYAEAKTKRQNAKADYDRQRERAERQKAEPVQRRQTQSDPVIGQQRLAAEADEKRGFKTPSEFLSAVMTAGQTGRVDERLNLCVAAGKSAAAGSDEHGTYSDPHGGFLIPKGFSPNLLSITAETDPLAGRTTQVPMESAHVSFPARVDKNHSSSVSGGLRVYRRVETQAVSDSRMEFEQVTLIANSLMGVSYATEELLARSPMSFVALLEAGFRDEFGAKMIDERINGTGVGMMEGVLNTPSLISVAKETGQAADTIVYENLVKMRARCWGYNNAVWLANNDTLSQLMLLNQAVGTGGAGMIWQPSARDGEPDTLLGRPIIFTDFVKTLGDAGDVILGNWTQYLEGTLTGLSMDESIHVRFLNHERTFKMWVENDGRCWWRSALTPKNSTVTRSPFVTLDARA